VADSYGINSHKLIYHPDRVGKWMAEGDTYPITVEISPSGACNYRCVFCAFDYLDYQPELLDRDLMINNLQEMQENGVKSVVICGEGEPLINRHTPDIINYARDIGLDVGMASNGVLFTPEIAQHCLRSLTWIRISLNAGSDENHQKIHKSKPGDYGKILDNLRYAVDTKKRNQLTTTIGVQLLLIPDNYHEVYSLAEQLKAIGVDYFTVKPYSQHPQSGSRIDERFDYSDFLDMEGKLNQLSTADFSIIFRSSSMKKLNQQRQYQQCWGLPFWAYIDAKANVYACIAYVGDDRFCYGNLKEHGFKELWQGEKRRKVIEHVVSMDLDGCRELCRLDEINNYLEKLKNPIAHVNFI